jgi:acetoin utilization deacetylase AcuC-like enzyme
MLPFKLVYSDDYYLPIGTHVFPAEKYQRIHKRLLEIGVADGSDFVSPRPASDQDILLVHTPQYVHKLKTGTLSAREELEMEIPYSPELVRAFWLAAGGSMLAADYALKDRVAFNIGGGFHHAFPDHGEGFCMIHDVAVAIRRLTVSVQGDSPKRSDTRAALASWSYSTRRCSTSPSLGSRA